MRFKNVPRFVKGQSKYFYDADKLFLFRNT